jgi:hypothetical protein
LPEQWDLEVECGVDVDGVEFQVVGVMMVMQKRWMKINGIIAIS